ncbi:MAG: sigma-54-dependent Fis family transcriptional regulator [Acidobacteria bacterium]|nr:sigma-54-dependent Fis family transcriptional regulator [Acidobacteriota bacterium]
MAVDIQKEQADPAPSNDKPAKKSVLVADDERGARMALEVALRLSGYAVVSVENGEAALEAGRKEQFDLLLTDVYMPGVNGLELIERFRAFSPETEIVVMTAQGSLEIAMQAVAQGAFDFIAKPFDIESVIALVRRATESAELPKSETSENENDFSASGLIGHSAPMVQVYKLIAYAARTETTVLIEGETGTGKELVARAIHQNSRRADKPFTAVNCSALTETLLESELFGYTKGSFTGAVSDRPGLFESSQGGTVFLDEISSASPSLQASLLRVLQEKEIRRIGSRETRKIDVRVIAASNLRLEKMVESGNFRADLFYRLSVLTMQLPPLRERGREDVELLARHFLRRHDRQHKSRLQITDSAIEALAAHEWAGNVRELENALEYAVAVCSNELITAGDLPPRIAESPADGQSGIAPGLGAIFSLAGDRPPLDELSRRYVDLVLSECGGNKSRAAEILGINRRTLYRYLDSYDDDGFTVEPDAANAEPA